MFGKKKNNEIVVQINELPSTTGLNELDLAEIKDKNVISRVTGTVPEIAQIIANTSIAVQGTKLANTGIYQAILPSGAKLVNSKEVQGAVRGFFLQGNGIGGHANFMSVDGVVGKIAAINVANMAMGAAALVVGQYYMNQINVELAVINKNLSKIADFQKSEYKSKAMTLLTQVKRATDFKTEILEDNELRKEEIMRLQGLETTCMELLSQANLAINQLSSQESADFEKYSKLVEETATWQKYQSLLIDVLFMIADLNYVLHLGALSKEQCYVAYSSLYAQTNKIVEKVKKWHEFHVRKLGIDIDQAKVERHGFDAFIHKPLSFFNKEFNYCSISKREVVNIRSQKNMQIRNMTLDMHNLYQEDVNIIIKDGKMYYLPGMYI